MPEKQPRIKEKEGAAAPVGVANNVRVGGEDPRNAAFYGYYGVDSKPAFCHNSPIFNHDLWRRLQFAAGNDFLSVGLSPEAFNFEKRQVIAWNGMLSKPNRRLRAGMNFLRVRSTIN
jgi:hypothetical protein